MTWSQVFMILTNIFLARAIPELGVIVMAVAYLVLSILAWASL